MKKYYAIALLLSASLLSGCAGVFVAGAATTVNLVTDTRSSKEIWVDNAIESEVAGLSNKQPYVGQVRVVASSQRGTVVLMGQAKTQELSNQVAQQVEKISDVKRVYNQMRIKAPIDLAAMSNDTWLTTKIKSSVLTDKRLSGIKIKVITEDSEVFLLGYVSKENGDIATDIARNTSGVKQVVRAFQYSEDEERLNTESQQEAEPVPAPVNDINSSPQPTSDAPQPIVEEPAPFLEVEG
ncbi:hypothetical protein VHP8226_02434 [Vibrio hippocampi]|uniref:BON domain-containing protein n=1 Tax=Vibrio hippocampi TaxID=654686 RepID=A0ABN8DHC2_9VIBR|nr:BON domain-containing protein [Vibrio hippocampi]CAH0527091.1 hypothetical protein VHP8226_02434 [Vibrio hippocampi]